MAENFSDFPESELITLYRSGNETAYAELARRVDKHAHYHLHSLPPSDRDDVSSVINEKVYRELGSFDTVRGGFATWVSAIARGAVIDHVRSRRALSSPVSLDANALFLENLASSHWDDISHAYVRHAQNMVLAAMDAVENELLRGYLIGRYVLLMDDAFLAGLFEVSEATVRSNLRRALVEFAGIFMKSHPDLADVDFQALADALKDGALPVAGETMTAIEDPAARALLSRICLDRFPVDRAAAEQRMTVEDAMAAVRKNIPALLRKGRPGKAEVPTVAEPSAAYQADTLPQAIENLILAALSHR